MREALPAPSRSSWPITAILPLPVIMAQKAIKADAPGELQVLVDNKCAVENVTRFGESQGYTVTAADNGDDEFTVTLRK